MGDSEHHLYQLTCFLIPEVGMILPATELTAVLFSGLIGITLLLFLLVLSLELFLLVVLLDVTGPNARTVASLAVGLAVEPVFAI